MMRVPPAVWQGFTNGLPFLLIVAPFALVFGVAGTEAGLPLSQVLGFSAVVVAGASQFAALQLMTENAGVGLVIAAALVVNLRMAMYSAALAPHVGGAPLWQRVLIGYLNFDHSFAVATLEYEKRPERLLSEKVGYFLGVAIPAGATWIGFTYVGAVIGATIPESYPIDFAVPIAFLALVAPALRTVAHVAAAATSAILALLLAWMPSGTGLIIAAVAAMVVGAEIERRGST